MADPIAALARQLDVDLLRLQATAQNVANANAPGYRAARVFMAEGVPTLRADLRTAGALDATGGALDLALVGSGWLVIATPDGERYTRAGDLKRLADGTLATQDGHAVLGSEGPIRLTNAPVVIDGQGLVTQDGEVRGRLRLADLPDPAKARLVGASAFAYDGEVGVTGGVRVVQGALERANVDVTDEMVRMMEATRHAESVQRAIGAYEQAMATALNELGRNR